MTSGAEADRKGRRGMRSEWDGDKDEEWESELVGEEWDGELRVRKRVGMRMRKGEDNEWEEGRELR